MRIECKREIETQCYEVLMEIGMEEYRPDIISVLKLAEEKRGAVTPKDISNHLLRGRPESVGEQIILRLQDYGLLEGFDQYNPPKGIRRNISRFNSGLGRIASLTDLGWETLSEESVMIPERAIYRVWVTEDPLVPNGLVAIERIRATRLIDDIDEMRNNENGHDSTAELISVSKIRFIEGSKHRILAGTEDFPAGSNIRIFKLEEKGRKVEGTRVRPSALLEIKHDGLTTLNVGVGNNKVSIKPPEVSSQYIMEEMAYSMDTSWNGEFIDAYFPSLDNNARKNFMIKKHRIDGLELETSEGGELGSFSVAVHAIPVDTTDLDIAEEWALWLLTENIHDYLKPEEYSDLVKEVTQKFKRVRGLVLPDQKSLADLAKRDDKKELFWYLQAPLDLDPAGVRV